MRYKKQKEEEEKHRSREAAVWGYLHAAIMSLGKRQHEIWTEGGSGRVNKDTVKENSLNKRKIAPHFKHPNLFITTQSLENGEKLRHYKVCQRENATHVQPLHIRDVTKGRQCDY